MPYSFEFGAEDTTGKGYPLLKGEVANHLLTLIRNAGSHEIYSDFALTDAQVTNFAWVQENDPNFKEEPVLSFYQHNIWFNTLLTLLHSVVEDNAVPDRTNLLKIIGPPNLQDLLD